MKKLLLLIPALLIAGMFFFGCQENYVTEPDSSSLNKRVGGYEIVLIGGAPVNNGDGTYTWTWSVTNTNPGNGKPGTGTFQNLSHWDFVPGDCLVADDIVSLAAGTDLTALTPLNLEIQDDPSMTCDNGNVLKFNFGTTGSVASYYQLVINKNYSVNQSATAYWKAGTACGQGTFDGIGCYNETDCNTETAWADGDRYVSRGNWATYTPYSEEGITVTLFAGQTLNAGTVTFSAASNGEVTITITLNANWSLQNVTEPVKIQDYEFAPSGNPNIGHFDHKFTDLTDIVVPANNYYGVHLDVQYCTPVE